MKKSFITLCIGFFATLTAFGQSVTISPSNAAVIEANATNKGILIPRMTTAQRNAITAPTAVTGLMVYDTDLKDLYIFNGFWKRSTIGEVPVMLGGNIANTPLLSATNTNDLGVGLNGASTTSGSGVQGVTQSGNGILGSAINGTAGSFVSSTGYGITAINTSNISATAKFTNNTVGAAALEVTGKMTLTTDFVSSAIDIVNTSIDINAKGVRGVSVNGVGVLGNSTTGTGTGGFSNDGSGVSGIGIGVTSNGVYGINLGTGTGVKGEASSGTAGVFLSTSGKGIEVTNSSATLPTATLKNNTSGGTAVEINGAIKVSGSSPAALQIEASTNVFSMPLPTTSANAQTDLIFITRATDFGGGTNTSYYAQWTGSDWEIRREDNGTIMAGTNLNILVIKQ
jgi:hypothetical protein